jgi:hypothetical protein
MGGILVKLTILLGVHYRSWGYVQTLSSCVNIHVWRKCAKGFPFMPSRLVILSNRSLFAEGVASRLLQYPERVEVHFVDSQQADYLELIREKRPAAVIIEAADANRSQCCLLCDLLTALSNVTIVRLEVHHKDIQIVTSWQYPLSEVRDLLDLIEQSPQILAD